MTDYERFQETVKNRILDFMPEEYGNASVDVELVQKNNNQVQAGLRIRRKGENVITTIYLEPYYRDLCNLLPEQAVLSHIAEEYVKGEQKKPQISGDYIMDFGSVKNHIHIQLVNKETNKNMLENCAKKEIEDTDLAVVFRIKIYDNGEEYGSLLISNGIMGMWDLDPEILYEIALKNTVEQLPVRIMDIRDVLCDAEKSLELEEVFSEEDATYTLTNSKYYDGASVLLYPGLLQSLAEKTGSDFYMLPSSIHEWMLVKDTGNKSIQEMQELVMDTNRRFVDPKEVLSDQVYRYDGKEQKFSMITTPEQTKETLKMLELFSDGQTDTWAGDMEEEIER